VTITERTQLFTLRVRLVSGPIWGARIMSEDRVPLVKEYAVRKPATTSRSRPDIVIRLARLEILAEPKPTPRP
jgi:hypothetical protein